MRKLDYSRQFVLDFGSVSSKFNRCSLIDEIFIRYEIDRSFIVIISLSLSLFTILPLPQSPSIKIFIVPPSKQRSIILPRATPSKELFERKGREERRKRRTGGRERGGGKRNGKEGRDFEKKNTRGARERGKEYFQEGCSSPLSPSVSKLAKWRVQRWKEEGKGGQREREGRSERKTRRNGPTAQQKRDKSSTLIRILPLFALWNTILNGMGAQ